MNTTTHEMPKLDAEGHTIKCGTATLGHHAEIELHVGSPLSEPIRARISHRLVIGRGDETASDVDINVTTYEAVQKGVSRCHAAFEVVNKILMVTDLKSTNGTFINGQPISPGQRRIVRDGDELLLGSLLIHIFYSRPKPQR